MTRGTIQGSRGGCRSRATDTNLPGVVTTRAGLRRLAERFDGLRLRVVDVKDRQQLRDL